jgi:hypothetical protein
MKVQLTRKLSEIVDGIDLSRVRVGDTFELPPRDALTLIAEGWALFVPDESREAGRDKAHDRPRRTRSGRTRLNQTKR